VEEKMKKTFIVSIIVSLIITTSFVAYMELARRPEDCHCDFDAMEKFALENGYSSFAEYEEAELEKIMN
jgi:hypothetical protein